MRWIIGGYDKEHSYDEFIQLIKEGNNSKTAEEIEQDILALFEGKTFIAKEV